MHTVGGKPVYKADQIDASEYYVKQLTKGVHLLWLCLTHHASCWDIITAARCSNMSLPSDAVWPWHWRMLKRVVVRGTNCTAASTDLVNGFLTMPSCTRSLQMMWTQASRAALVPADRM